MAVANYDDKIAYIANHCKPGKRLNKLCLIKNLF